MYIIADMQKTTIFETYQYFLNNYLIHMVPFPVYNNLDIY